MDANTHARVRVLASNEKLCAWLESQSYCGIDPYDALNSPLLGAVARRSRYLGIALTQLVRRSPINLRPLLGIRPGYNPKGMGLFLASFVRRYAAQGHPSDLERARFFCDWLCTNSIPGFHGACWGYNFDWANRGFYAPRGTPTLVNTAFIAQALDDFAVVCGDPRAFDMARSACDFILYDLNRFENQDGICFSYTPLDTRCVHNANLLGAALLARMGVRTGEAELLETARRAAAFTVAAQLPDGSWKYGTAARDGWCDNFHTGFVLGALADVIEALGCADWESALEKGYAFWCTNFFSPDGAPKYTPDRLYPIDIHAVTEAILLSLRMQKRDPAAREFAARQLDRGIEHFQDAAGYFYYQILPHATNRIPFIRWSNAWMLRAQAEWLWGSDFESLCGIRTAS